jgi:hypothetical protein
VWAAWWQEKQDEVVNCKVAAKNQSLHIGLVGLVYRTNTEPGQRGGQIKSSLSWWLHHVYEVCGGLHTKPSGSLVAPQSQGRRLDVVETGSGHIGKL